MFQLNMADIAFELATDDPRFMPMVHRFGQHFVIVANVLQRPGPGGTRLWSEDDHFYFDAIRRGGDRMPLKIYSVAGLVPLFATSVKSTQDIARLPTLRQNVELALGSRKYLRAILPSYIEPGHNGMRMLSAVNRDGLVEMLRRMLDRSQFLSDFGIRSLSREHEANPYRFDADGTHYEIAYQPGVSDSRMFGGNSNWRGPVWFPMNFLLVQAIATFSRYYGDGLTMECPTGSGRAPEPFADCRRSRFASDADLSTRR